MTDISTLSDAELLALRQPSQLSPLSQMSDEDLLAARKPDPSSPISWSQVNEDALKNSNASGGRLLRDTVMPIMHPIDTAKNVGKLVAGGVEKLIPGDQGHEKYADAVGGYFKDRYGGWNNIKHTMAEDPWGILADATIPLSGGEALAARVPGVVGRMGRIGAEATRAIDPIAGILNAGKKTAGGVGKGTGVVGSELLGLRTGTGGESIREAARSGFEGGAGDKAFLGELRGPAKLESDLVQEARGAVGNMYEKRGTDYMDAKGGFMGLGGWAANRKPISFMPIDAADAQLKSFGELKGAPPNEALAPVKKEIGTLINQWRLGDPERLHTVQGLDNLKKRIGAIKDAQEYGTDSWKVANDMYNSVWGTIAKHDPEYAKAMGGYADASDKVKEIQRTLGLKKGSSEDTALRKLTSVMRNNVNTNFGSREAAAKALEEAGAPNLMKRIAGQSLNAKTPRGLVKLLTAGEGLALPITALTNPHLLPLIMADMATQSPRVIGELAHLGGKGAGYAAAIAKRLHLGDAVNPYVKSGYAARGLREEPEVAR